MNETASSSQAVAPPPSTSPDPFEKKQLQAFRALAITEGISLLLLFFVAMPVKYLLGYPQMVSVVGMIHGILFLGYVGALVMWRSVLGWSWGWVVVAVLAASVPFATFFPKFHGPAEPAKN